MNVQNFNQSGGFPLQTETLTEMQNAYSLFNSLGYIAGNYAIIQGCEVSAGQVSNGVVIIDGEVLEFRGGNIGTDVIIGQEITTQEFQDGNDKEVLFVRYATFGIGANSIPWANFKRPKNTLQLTEDKLEVSLYQPLLQRVVQLENRPVSNVPIGMIAIWDRPANEIPQGWEEYEELRGRMPVGLNPNDGDFDALNVVGGQKTKTLSIAEMPEHDHQGHVMEASGDWKGGGNNSAPNATSYPGSTNKKGSGQAFSIMNPYRIVHFIKYVG
jgi:hypothetical protein